MTETADRFKIAIQAPGRPRPKEAVPRGLHQRAVPAKSRTQGGPTKNRMRIGAGPDHRDLGSMQYPVAVLANVQLRANPV